MAPLVLSFFRVPQTNPTSGGFLCKDLNMNNLKRNWLIFSASGLVLVGFGLSLMGEALMLKYENADFQSWFWFGTLSLVVINTGLALFGKAVTLRVRLDRLKEVNNS